MLEPVSQGSLSAIWKINIGLGGGFKGGRYRKKFLHSPPYGKLTLGWEEDSKEGAIERSFYIVRHNMGDTISGGGGHTESLATPIYIVGPWPYHV